MKEFKITEQQLQTIAVTLGEFPAKAVLSAIDILRALPEISSQEGKYEPVQMENK